LHNYSEENIDSYGKFTEVVRNRLQEYGEGSVADGCHVGTEERETIYLRLEGVTSMKPEV
jgi:hypothetical protein